MTRPGLLGDLDARMERIRAICDEEGASTNQFATWMTSAMAEVIRGADETDFAASRAWLRRHHERQGPSARLTVAALREYRKNFTRRGVLTIAWRRRRGLLLDPAEELARASQLTDGAFT